MKNTDSFIKAINKSYHFSTPSLILGSAMLDGKPVSEAKICIPLKLFTRHGLIAGATGTGKTKTLQVLAELLSDQGVSSLLMDIKGDLSGLGAPGESIPKVIERQKLIGLTYDAAAFPLEFLTLSDEPGVRLRTTISELGPQLFAKMLELNETQTGVIAILFKYCEDQKLPLLDIKDFKQLVQFVQGEGKPSIEASYGNLSTTSIGTLMRKLIELEQQGGERLFGEPSFNVNDLLEKANSKGTLSIIRLTDIQDRPKLYSTFMLSLLNEVYKTFPEVGDLDKPKCVIFIDEAHLLFQNASDALLQQIDNMVKLIRSKGVGIFFITQSPRDIPESVLSQLGTKIQHALRAFTAKDRKDIKLIAENFPSSDFYKTNDLLMSLGIGEALVTTLDEKGRPTELAATFMRAPRSRMGILEQSEIEKIARASELAGKYQQVIDKESAYELLNQRLADKGKEIPVQEGKPTGGFLEKLSKNTLFRQLNRAAVKEIIRQVSNLIKPRK